MRMPFVRVPPLPVMMAWLLPNMTMLDRKSTRLNSSHSQISYAVFCLKKKKISLVSFCHHRGALLPAVKSPVYCTQSSATRYPIRDTDNPRSVAPASPDEQYARRDSYG